MADIVPRSAVRGPQHLVSRSDAAGSGLLKVDERKDGARMLMEAHSGMHRLCYCTIIPEFLGERPNISRV